jgi:hypothetical protein
LGSWFGVSTSRTIWSTPKPSIRKQIVVIAVTPMNEVIVYQRIKGRVNALQLD